MTDEKEKAEKVIKRLDGFHFKHRVKRLMELEKVTGIFEIDRRSWPITPPAGAPLQFLWGYIKEAQSSYLEDNCRSCVFCCAAEAEQILKYEIALASDNFQCKIEEFESGYFGLGKLIRELDVCKSENERIVKLKNLKESLDWLNKARNAIATHPDYVSLEVMEDDEGEKEWKVNRIVVSIKRILNLLTKEEQSEILDFKIEVSPEKTILEK